MAKYITRTEASVVTEAKVFDTNTNEVETMQFVLTGVKNDWSAVEKATEKLIRKEMPDIKFLKVEAFDIVEKRYRMLTEQFIELAEEY